LEKITTFKSNRQDSQVYFDDLINDFFPAFIEEFLGVEE
jgi:hypothetical protein